MEGDERKRGGRAGVPLVRCPSVFFFFFGGGWYDGVSERERLREAM